MPNCPVLPGGMVLVLKGNATFCALLIKRFSISCEVCASSSSLTTTEVSMKLNSNVMPAPRMNKERIMITRTLIDKEIAAFLFIVKRKRKKLFPNLVFFCDDDCKEEK